MASKRRTTAVGAVVTLLAGIIVLTASPVSAHGGDCTATAQLEYHSDIDRLHGHSTHKCPEPHYKMTIEILVQKRQADGSWSDWDSGVLTDCCNITSHSRYTSRECTDGTYRMYAYGSIVNSSGIRTHFEATASQGATTFNC